MLSQKIFSAFLSADLVNGIFELVGGIIMFFNCRRLYRDKQVRGVMWQISAFYTVWGGWNLYYYPHLHQMLSFAGGILIVIANSIWIAQAIYYERKLLLNKGL